MAHMFCTVKSDINRLTYWHTEEGVVFSWESICQASRRLRSAQFISSDVLVFTCKSFKFPFLWKDGEFFWQPWCSRFLGNLATLWCRWWGHFMSSCYSLIWTGFRFDNFVGLALLDLRWFICIMDIEATVMLQISMHWTSKRISSFFMGYYWKIFYESTFYTHTKK